jgi:multidrug efflux pump subunit AcrA (membrane-fusion protein)
MAEENQTQGGEQDQAAEPSGRPGPDTWAAVQLLEAAPSLVTRGLVYLSLVVLATAVVYAAVTQLEVVVRCPAVIQASQVSRVSAAEAGVVERVVAGPGQHVRKGEPVLLLRPAGWVEGAEPTAVAADADGVVLELPAADRGVAVGKGDLLWTLHPDGAGLRVELKLPNRDVGRVQPGMPISLRVDAYPVAEFGVVRTEVGVIAPAAREDPQLGWVYPVSAKLPQAWIEAHGKRFQVRPGMTATAEIVVGRRSMLSSLVGSTGD